MASDIQTSVLLTVMLKELDAKYIVAKVQSPIHSKI
jgi:Trk K+ transport system NAD-binding subunit